MRAVLLSVVFGLACLMASPSGAASFDCGKAKSKFELLICGTPALNQADEEMGQAYKAANDSFPVKGFVRATQTVFLMEYRACANDKAKDKGAAACIDLARRRTQELQDMHKAKVYVDGVTSYTPEDVVIMVGERLGQMSLSVFGAWMPDAYRPKPFPDGFICNESFPLEQAGGTWRVKDADWDVKIDDRQIEAEFYSCSPRNGFSGTFKRLR